MSNRKGGKVGQSGEAKKKEAILDLNKYMGFPENVEMDVKAHDIIQIIQQ